MWGSVITLIAVVDIQCVGIDRMNNDGARVGHINGEECGEIPSHIDKGKKGIHVMNGMATSSAVEVGVLNHCV